MQSHALPLPTPSLPRWLRRRQAGDVRLRWVAAWLGAAAIGVGNGGAREVLYAGRLGERRAHGVSTATALALLAGYVWLLQRRWPLPSSREAAAVGAIWVGLTILFEFGFGHYVGGDPWSELLRAYDLTSGQLWVLVPAWLGVGPAVVRRLAARRSA